MEIWVLTPGNERDIIGYLDLVRLTPSLIGKFNIESFPYPPKAPSARGGHRVWWSGCRRGQRCVEQLQECRHFLENSLCRSLGMSEANSERGVQLV